MDLGAILLLLALLLGVGLFLAAPLMGGLPSSVSQETREASSLMAERDRVINALQELDFDFKLGKIPEEDYPGQRKTLAAERRRHSSQTRRPRTPVPGWINCHPGCRCAH